MPRHSKQHKKSKTSSIVKIERMFAPSTDNNRISKVRLVYNSTITSSGGGFVVTTLNMNPNAGSEWASYAALYDEFRVMGIRITFISEQQYSVTTANGLVGVVYDNDDATALTSLAAALEYDTCQIIPAVFGHVTKGENHTPALQLSWARPTAGQATAINWIDVATPSVSPGSIKMYSDTLTAGTKYFSYVLEFFCQFRGRR